MDNSTLKKELTAGPLLILILGLLTALGPLSIDMYLPAFQAIGQDLSASMAMVQQTLSVYFLGMALGQLVYGPLSDRWGRKKPLLIGLFLYIISSIGCTLVPDITALILLRLFQALGGCSGVVVARAVARDYFPPREMARVMSLLMLVMGLAPVFAPAFGGVLVKYLPAHIGWRTVFGILAILGTACALMVWKILPESLPKNQRLKELSLPYTFNTYLLLLTDQRFLLPTLAGGLALGSLFTYISASSAMFVDFFKLSPFHYSLLFAGNAIGIIGGAQVNRYLLKTRTPETVMSKALTLSVISAGALWIYLFMFPAQLLFSALGLWIVLATLGFVMPNSAAIALAEQKENAGSASAMMGVLQYATGAFSSALVAWLLVYLQGEPIAVASVMLATLAMARLIYRPSPTAHIP